jgi:hypothetical protein
MLERQIKTSEITCLCQSLYLDVSRSLTTDEVYFIEYKCYRRQCIDYSVQYQSIAP